MIRISASINHHVERLVARIIFHQFLFLLSKNVCERLVAHDEAIGRNGHLLVISTIENFLGA